MSSISKAAISIEIGFNTGHPFSITLITMGFLKIPFEI